MSAWLSDYPITVFTRLNEFAGRKTYPTRENPFFLSPFGWMNWNFHLWKPKVFTFSTENANASSLNPRRKKKKKIVEIKETCSWSS